MFSLFTGRKNEITTQITAINNEITLLQQELQKQQQFLQEIGTVEQAGESALAQAQTFLAMVRMIDPSQETVFWDAMDALKTQNQAVFPVPEVEESAETDSLEVEAVEVAEADEETEESVSNALDVEAVEVEESEEKIPTVEDAAQPLTNTQVKCLDWVILRQIAIAHNIVNPSGQRLTRKFTEKALHGIVTTLDVTAAKTEINKQTEGYSFGL